MIFNVINSDLVFKEADNYRTGRKAYCWDGLQWLLFTADYIGRTRTTQEGHGYHGVFIIIESEQNDSSENSNHEFHDRYGMFRMNPSVLEPFFFLRKIK